MNFTDGYWHVKEGVTLYNAVELCDAEIVEKSITAYAACKSVVHRGDTLNSPLLTFNFSSPMNDVIRVQVYHHMGGLNSGPAFKINKDDNCDVQTGDHKDYLYLRSGKLEMRVYRGKTWRIDYLYDGRRITGNSIKSTGYAVTPDKKAYMREQLDISVGELVYGLGERFGPFVKNGQSVDIWNEDGGTSSEQAYKNIPFYITNKGYGVFTNHPEMVSYEITSENVSRAQFSVAGESLDYFVIGARDMKHVLANYTRLTGRPALPPAWSFGLWLTTSFTTNYDEATVNSFIDGMSQRNLPLHVFHFDCFWMKEYQWCDFQWDSVNFPNPEAQLKRLKDKGLKICVWINSYIAQKSRLFAEGKAKGYLVKRPDGSVWQWDRWQAGMGLVDFTNPEAVKWYQSKLKALLDIGVDCFKTDFGERIPTDVVYFDGSDPVKMHNYYTLLYNRAVFELLQRERGKNEAAVFARSATVGGQQYPVHWGGDSTATYTSMAETLRGGLSLAMGGFGFWSHDISGFEKTAPPDLFKRWVAFGLLSSHSRLHGNESYRVPWLFDEEAVDVLRFFTNLKCKLMPYIYNAAGTSSAWGIPVIRPMVLEFANDQTCGYLDRQYMLGNSLLVAPVFSEDSNVEYYLPAGKWTNFITGAKVEGGRWIKEKHGYLSMPLMARPNSIIAVGKVDNKPDYDFADGVTFHIFELTDGVPASTPVCSADGQKVMDITAKLTGKEISIEATATGKPWYVLLRNNTAVKSVKGAIAETTPEGIKLTPEKDVQQILVKLQ
jgi:alpha-D-xyloside xylohydrolase